jgi:hypothetical protein
MCLRDFGTIEKDTAIFYLIVQRQGQPQGIAPTSAIICRGIALIGHFGYIIFFSGRQK